MFLLFFVCVKHIIIFTTPQLRYTFSQKIYTFRKMWNRNLFVAVFRFHVNNSFLLKRASPQVCYLYHSLYQRLTGQARRPFLPVLSTNQATPEGGEPKGWSEYLFLTFKQTVHSALVKCQSHPTDFIRGPPCTAVSAMNMPYRSRISDLCVQLSHLIFIFFILSADENLR